MKHLKLLFLFIISFPVLSRIWGKITKLTFPALLIQKVIGFYASHYEIDMKNFEGELEDYDSLCAFFTRKTDPSVRPLKNDENAFLSPCDGVVSVLENIHADVATQVKGKTYLVSELVKKELPFEKGFWRARRRKIQGGELHLLLHRGRSDFCRLDKDEFHRKLL